MGALDPLLASRLVREKSRARRRWGQSRRWRIRAGLADRDPRKTHVAALYGAAAGFGGWASRDAVSRRKGKRGIPSPLR